jgi:hypothetical protein
MILYCTLATRRQIAIFCEVLSDTNSIPDAHFFSISAGTSHSPSFILRLSGSNETPKILALCRCIVYVLKYMNVCSYAFMHSPGHILAHDLFFFHIMSNEFRLLFCLASNLMCTDFNACNRKHLRITTWADTETPEPWKSGDSQCPYAFLTRISPHHMLIRTQYAEIGCLFIQLKSSGTGTYTIFVLR